MKSTLYKDLQNSEQNQLQVSWNCKSRSFDKKYGESKRVKNPLFRSNSFQEQLMTNEALRINNIKIILKKMINSKQIKNKIVQELMHRIKVSINIGKKAIMILAYYSDICASRNPNPLSTTIPYHHTHLPFHLRSLEPQMITLSVNFFFIDKKFIFQQSNCLFLTVTNIADLTDMMKNTPVNKNKKNLIFTSFREICCLSKVVLGSKQEGCSQADQKVV